MGNPLKTVIYFALTCSFGACNPNANQEAVSNQIVVPPCTDLKWDTDFFVPIWSYEKQKWGYFSPKEDSLVLDYQFDNAGTFQNGIAIGTKFSETKEEETVFAIQAKDGKIETNMIFAGQVNSWTNSLGLTRIGSIGLLVNSSVAYSHISMTGKVFGSFPKDENVEKAWIFREGIVLYATPETYCFRDFIFEDVLILERDRYEIDFYDLVSLKSADAPNLFPIIDTQAPKYALVDFGGTNEFDFIWDNVSICTPDSIFLAQREGKQILLKWPETLIGELPDSISAKDYLSSFNTRTSTIVLEDTSKNRLSKYLIFNVKTGSSTPIPGAMYLKRLSDSVFAGSMKNGLHLLDYQGKRLSKIEGNDVEGIDAEIGASSNDVEIWQCISSKSQKTGVINSDGKVIIPLTFDKIDIAESPWHFDFPYIVASRDSGSFHEVFLFGIEGDTLAGPMRLKKWSRGSAYGHNSFAEHVLNHSDWRGTPKEEMLFYIEWEDADSVLHKGYIDFFGHLYE